MNEFIKKLKEAGFTGEVDNSNEVLDFYSHDASLFEIRPKLIVFPTDNKDVEILTSLVAREKKNIKGLSLTARSAGTDMSGAAINDSIIVDFTKHFTNIGEIRNSSAKTQPGVYYRDFDVETRKRGYLLPTFPASRDLCTVGGMVNNNSGGEKSIEFGKTDLFINSLRFVFSDGVSREVKPLKKVDLDKKMAQNDFEGEVYTKLFNLINNNYDLIKSAKPNVSKDSTGYHLWDVWDKKTQIFDITKAIVGAQGTLGLVTDIDFKLTKARPESGVLVIFMNNIDNLGGLIEKVVEHNPSRFESFDDQTLMLSLRFMPKFYKMLGLRKFIRLIFSLIPDALQLTRGIPRQILLISFKGNTDKEIFKKIQQLHAELDTEKKQYGITGFEVLATDEDAQKFWIMRRYSFKILRDNVKDKHTAPFIDDLVVNPQHLSKFLPEIRKIIKKYRLFATISGHMGDGNFHIIPLMRLDEPSERAKLEPAMREVNNLVLKYKGSLSGEHNDGLVRGPWLEQMYGQEVVELFRQTKDIFDPQGIFNPHKKANATWEYSFNHVRDHF